MTRIKRWLAALAAAAAWGTAGAQETGVYVGLSIGYASYREACADFNRIAGSAAAFTCTTKEDTAGKLFAGWRFHRNFAAEVSYLDFGEAKETGSIAGAPVSASSKSQAAGLAVLGILPVSANLSVFGKVGLAEVRSRTTAANGVETEKETEVQAGVGGLYQLARGWGLRAEYERVNDTKIDLFSFGVQYRF